MNSKVLSGFRILGVVAALVAGCGDGDGTTIEGCTAGIATCLTSHGGVVCSSDGTSELPFSCSDGEVCETVDGRAACAGACEPGQKECASETISRVCTNEGNAWIPVECQPGTGCDDAESTAEGEPNPEFGTCVRTDRPRTVCTRGQTTCADGRTVKSCEEDGSNWVYSACIDNEECVEGECVIDPDKRCTPNTGTCMDALHVRKCADDGLSYETPEACPGDTLCSDGACRGSVCTVDEVRCDDVRDGNVFSALAEQSYQPRAVYHCEDGESWRVTECEPTQVCAYTNISSTAVNQYVEDLKSAIESDASLPVFVVPESSRATCQTPECSAPFALRELLGARGDGASFGSFACGDPTSEDSTFIDSFSLCEGLPPYNNLHWANYSCPEGSECTYQSVMLTTGAAQAPVCSSNCSDVRCFDTLGESTITCHDGEWDLESVTRCRDGRREQWCRRNVTSSGTNFTQASCQDPACVVWQDEFETVVVPPGYGACGDDGRFYQCLANGLMDAEGEPCAGCTRSVRRAPEVLAPDQTPSFFAGYQPGYCLPECAPDEQTCVSIQSSAPSPFYYTCADGHFTTLAACGNGEACNEYVIRGTTLRRIICGGDCVPQEEQCVTEDGIPLVGGELVRICDDAGDWGEPETCTRGVCTEDDQDSSSGVAVCEDECIPGTRSCEDEGEVRCDARARYGDPVPCPAREHCFVGDPRLARLGCIECKPFEPQNPGSVADSRCDGSVLEVCGPEGTFATSLSTTCPLGCTGTSVGSTVPGESRASCRSSTGGGGMSGSGGAAGASGTAGGGSGGLGAAGGGSGGLGTAGGGSGGTQG